MQSFRFFFFLKKKQNKTKQIIIFLYLIVVQKEHEALQHVQFLGENLNAWSWLLLRLQKKKEYEKKEYDEKQQ